MEFGVTWTKKNLIRMERFFEAGCFKAERTEEWCNRISRVFDYKIIFDDQDINNGIVQYEN